MGSSILFRAQSISIGHLLHFASFSAEKPPSPGSLPWLSPFLHSSCVSQPPVLIFLHTHLFLQQAMSNLRGGTPSESGQIQAVAILPLSDEQWYIDAHSPCSRSGMLCPQPAALCHYGKPGCHAEPEEKILGSLCVFSPVKGEKRWEHRAHLGQLQTQ